MAQLLPEVFQGLSYVVFLGGTALLAWIDMRTILLPNRVLYPVTTVGFALLVVTAAMEGQWPCLGIALGSAVALLIVFGVLYRLTSLGFGDVRLAGLLGLFLGWAGPTAVVDGLLFGMAGAALVAGVLLATKRMERTGMVAYGPFLIGGAWLALLWQAI